jgi:hypothetical protein
MPVAKAAVTSLVKENRIRLFPGFQKGFMYPAWQIKTVHQKGKVTVSTIRLPFFFYEDSLNPRYETCIFYKSQTPESEVVERYKKEGAAIAGHYRHASQFGPAMKWYEILWYNLTHQ